MDIPYSRWYPVIATRRSRRQFDQTKNIPDDILNRLRIVCADFKPFTSARAELVTQGCDEVFKGVMGSYGKVKCAQAFVAFIGDMTSEYVQEQVGYTGEGIILEATALELATCWVAGFFKPETVKTYIKIRGSEKVLAITPVGYAKDSETWEEKVLTGFGRNHLRKPVSSLATGLENSRLPQWINVALQAARWAPSAINRQPWGFQMESDNSITVSVRTRGPEFTVSKRLDCGIAMLHLQVAALESGVSGKWEFLKSPDVARFMVS